VWHKKGVEELLHVQQPSCTCTLAKCVHAAGGQWTVKREEEGRRGEKQGEAGRTDPFGGISGA
jgi:hypothetical protein